VDHLASPPSRRGCGPVLCLRIGQALLEFLDHLTPLVKTIISLGILIALFDIYQIQKQPTIDICRFRSVIFMTELPNLDFDSDPIWSGRPDSGVIVMRTDIIFLPLVIIWFIILVHIIESIDLEVPHMYRILFYVFTCTVVLVGRFVFDRKIRSGTVYTLTHRRFYISYHWPLYWSKSISIYDLSSYSISYTLNNKVIIDLGRSSRDAWPATRWSAWLPSLSRRWRLLGIPDKDSFIKVFASIRGY